MLKSRPMRWIWIGVFFCSMSLALGSVCGAPQDTGARAAEKLVSPEALQGCYELTLSPWFPDMKLGEDEQFITPPARIQLFAEKGTEGPESNGYLVRPAPGVPPSVHSSTYWTPKGAKGLEITFTTGFSGVLLSLKTSDAEVLHGKGTTFWDFNRRKQTAEVMARRVPCGKQ